MAQPRKSVVVGARELERALKALGNEIGEKLLLAALRAGAKPIVKEARRLVPVRTGALKKAIAVIKATKRQRRRGLAGLFIGIKGSPARRAHLVEFGTVHFRARPYLRPALDAKAKEAIERANTFLQTYYPWRRPMSAQKEGDSWFVVFNVGILLAQERVEVTIDAATGSITGYRTPEPL